MANVIIDSNDLLFHQNIKTSFQISFTEFCRIVCGANRCDFINGQIKEDNWRYHEDLSCQYADISIYNIGIIAERSDIYSEPDEIIFYSPDIVSGAGSKEEFYRSYLHDGERDCGISFQHGNADSYGCIPEDILRELLAFCILENRNFRIKLPDPIWHPKEEED